jgi:hypothetical protein
MAISPNPEKGRKSSGASWPRNGQAKRAETLDTRTALIAKQRKTLREKQFADGRWWKWRPHPKSVDDFRPIIINIKVLGKNYIVRRIRQTMPFWVDMAHRRMPGIKRSVLVVPKFAYYTVQVSGQPVEARFMSIYGVQMYFNELRREALLPLDDPNRPLPVLFVQPKRVWKPSPWLFIRDRLEDALLEQQQPAPQPVLIQDLQSNAEALAQIEKQARVDDLVSAVQSAVEHPEDHDAHTKVLDHGFVLLIQKDGAEVWLVHKTWSAFRRLVGVRSNDEYTYVGRREDIDFLIRATRSTVGKPIKSEPQNRATLPFVAPVSKQPDPGAPLVFPLMLDKTTVHHARIKISRYTIHDGSGSKKMGHNVWLESMGRTGKQSNNYSLKAKIQSQGDVVLIDTGGATTSHIPLSEWRTFVDQLDVEVSGVSVTTIKQTPLLDKMCRDVIAGRRKAPTVKEWEAEVASQETPASSPVSEPAAPEASKPAAPIIPLKPVHEYYKGTGIADVKHALKEFERKHGIKATTIYVPEVFHGLGSRDNVLDVPVVQSSEIHKGKIKLVGPHPKASTPDATDLIVTSRPATKLMHGGKTFQTIKDSCAHIVVTADFDGGRLKRAAGDPLCQPASKFPRLLDFIPAGDPVCQTCAEMAERYDLPLPPNVAVVNMPSSRKLTDKDPQVRYKLDSKWFSYESGFPFNGYLRSWAWLMQRTVCKCGAKVTDQRSDEPVLGMEIYFYRRCTAGHPIRDERDLRWPGPYLPKNPGVEGKAYDASELLESDAYKHLTAVSDPIDELPL